MVDLHPILSVIKGKWVKYCLKDHDCHVKRTKSHLYARPQRHTLNIRTENEKDRKRQHANTNQDSVFTLKP